MQRLFLFFTTLCLLTMTVTTIAMPCNQVALASDQIAATKAYFHIADDAWNSQHGQTCTCGVTHDRTTPALHYRFAVNNQFKGTCTLGTFHVLYLCFPW